MKLKNLIYSDELSKKYNAKIYLKPEWYGETGSHKDRWAKAVIDMVRSRNIKKVVTMSSGNQGLALAAQAKKHNIECVVIAWEEMPQKYIPLFEKYDAKLIFAKNSQQRSTMFKSFVNGGYFPCFLTLSQRKTQETLGIDGYQIISQEIIKNLKQAPDLVVIPTCYGDLAQGIFQGFKKSDKIPKFILARAKDPVGDIAFSISTNATTKYVRSVLKYTHGKSIFLTNDDFKKAKRYAKKNLNLNLEYSSAGAVAALEKLGRGEIENKTTVLILTALERQGWVSYFDKR